MNTQTKNKPHNKTRSLVLSILPVLIILAGIAGYFAIGLLHTKIEKEPILPKTTTVLTVRPLVQNIQLQVKTQGEVRPRTEIDLAVQIGGIIEYIAPSFVQGGAFAKGDVLLRIDPADYKLRVIQAKASVAQAKQTLVREQAEAEIAASDWAELGQGAASALTLRKPQLAGAKAALAGANASLADANLQLSRTTIRAPFYGRVRTKGVGIGQYVTPGTRLGRIFATAMVEVRVPLNDAQLEKLALPLAFVEGGDRVGPAVSLSAIVAGKPRTWQGRITRTDSVIDTKTRVLYAFVEVKEPYGAGADQGMPLSVGLFVGAQVLGRELPNALVLPRSALRGNDQVFIAKKGKLIIQKVDVAQSDQTRAVIVGGLSPADLVIISPVRGARSGMNIHVQVKTMKADPS